MKRFISALIAVPTTLLIVATLSQGAIASPQDTGQWDAAALKKAVGDIGYEVKELNKELGKEKYELTLTRDDLNIPMAAEITASKNFIWLTVYLGPAPKADSPKSSEMLKQNYQVQPTQFYVTAKGNLMMGLAVDNRGMTNSVLRNRVEKIAGDVAKSKSVWQ